MMSSLIDALSSPSGTQSLVRGIDVLKLIAANNSRGLRLVDLVKETSTERPTMHRAVQALVASGLIKRTGVGKRYVLGDYCYELAVALPVRSDLRGICLPALDKISKITGNSAFLVMRLGNDSLCIARTIGSYPIQVLSVRVGNRIPLGIGAGGLAILAELPEEERREIYKVNAHRISSFGGMNTTILKGLAAATRDRGYSVVGHYSVPGVFGIGVVLKNAQLQAVGSITSASIDSRMTKSIQAQTAQLMHEAISDIQLGLDNVPPYLGTPDKSLWSG